MQNNRNVAEIRKICSASIREDQHPLKCPPPPVLSCPTAVNPRSPCQRFWARLPPLSRIVHGQPTTCASSSPANSTHTHTMHQKAEITVTASMWNSGSNCCAASLHGSLWFAQKYRCSTLQTGNSKGQKIRSDQTVIKEWHSSCLISLWRIQNPKCSNNRNFKYRLTFILNLK